MMLLERSQKKLALYTMPGGRHTVSQNEEKQIAEAYTQKTREIPHMSTFL
jgi:hypothetical protein